MIQAEHVAVQPVEAVCFTSDGGTKQFRAGPKSRSGLVVDLAVHAGRQAFHCDPGQADALGRWLVEKAAQYYAAPRPTVMVLSAGSAEYDMVEQALEVVAGLDAARAV